MLPALLVEEGCTIYDPFEKSANSIPRLSSWQQSFIITARISGKSVTMKLKQEALY